MSIESSLGHKESPVGVRQYALGMGLLICPEKFIDSLAPELLEGAVSDEECALAVVKESSKLALSGLAEVLDSTRKHLGLSNISSLRPLSIRPDVDTTIAAQFEGFYDLLNNGEAGDLNELPGILRVTRFNPLSDAGLLGAMTHHKNRLNLEDLSGPLPVPYWVESSGLTRVAFSDLDIGLRTIS